MFSDNIPNNRINNYINCINNSICETEFRLQLIDDLTILLNLMKLKISCAVKDGLIIAFIIMCCPKVVNAVNAPGMEIYLLPPFWSIMLIVNAYCLI